jgi:hypothetical protein
LGKKIVKSEKIEDKFSFEKFAEISEIVEKLKEG